MQQQPILAVDEVDCTEDWSTAPTFFLFLCLVRFFLATVSCHVPVLLTVVTVAIKFLGALTFALTSNIVLATLAIDLLTVSFLAFLPFISISLLAGPCPYRLRTTSIGCGPPCPSDVKCLSVRKYVRMISRKRV